MKKLYLYKVLLAIFIILTLSYVSGCSKVKYPNDTATPNDTTLIENGVNLFNFTIVCDNNSKDAGKRALEVSSVIERKTDVRMRISDSKSYESEYEIIVMETSRELTQTLKNSIISKGGGDDHIWGFAFDGKHLAIYATGDYAWSKCINEFEELFFENDVMIVKEKSMHYTNIITKEEYELEQKRKETYLDPIFTSNMVLQRDRPVIIYGTGIGHVSVEFCGNVYKGITKNEAFTVTLPATPAGGPYSIKVTIEGTETILDNILFGEVILLAGQSNAELPLGSTDYPENKYVSNDRIRTYFVGQHFSEEISFKSILDNRWASLSADEANKWCAIAYHLGRKIEAEHDMPVGIICVVRGASVIQSFMSPEAQKDFVFDPSELSVEHPCNTTVERYKCYNQQGVIYEKMFSKVTPYTVSSVIWYQGESNIGSGESKVYDKLLQAMICEWRRDLQNDELPFIIVKLHRMSNNAGWLAVREAQERAAVNIPNCQLISLDSLGICTDIHPQNKEGVSDLIYDGYYQNNCK